MANNPITPTKVNFVTGDVLTAQQVNDLASALNRDVAFATQATANSTKTLVVTDAKTQEFTGTVAGQIVVMPVTSTLGVGMPWLISNKSTQTIAVNSSGGNLIYTVPAATDWLFTCALITGTTAASWSNSYAGASAVPTSGGLTLLSTTSLSTGTTVSPTIGTGYKNLFVLLKNVYTSVDDTTILMRLNGDSASNYCYADIVASQTNTVSARNSASATGFTELIFSTPNAATALLMAAASINIYSYLDTTRIYVDWTSNGNAVSRTQPCQTRGAGFYDCSAAITTVTVTTSTGTFSGGTMEVYGVN